MRPHINPTELVQWQACSVVESGYAIETVAAALGVPARMLSRWMQHNEAGDYDWIEAAPRETVEKAEIRRLESELQKVRAERDILRAISSKLKSGMPSGMAVEAPSRSGDTVESHATDDVP
jgi:transposase-like protein